MEELYSTHHDRIIFPTGNTMNSFLHTYIYTYRSTIKPIREKNIYLTKQRLPRELKRNAAKHVKSLKQTQRKRTHGHQMPLR